MAKKSVAAKSKVKKGKEVAAPEAPESPELHERIMSAGEASRLLNKAGLAVAYLVARDGMDDELAASIVEGLDSEALHELITEALIAPDPNVKPGAQPERVGLSLEEQEQAKRNTEAINNSTAAQEVKGGQLVPNREPKEPEHVDLFAVEALITDPDDIPTMIGQCIAANDGKKACEILYKDLKQRLVPKLKAAGALKVQFGDIKLSVYTGHHISINEQKLLEKGVSPDIIKACKVDTPYDDVQITTPKEAK